MQKRMLTPALPTLAMTLALSISAQAGATRTFVSTIGNDSNTSANCSPSSPCRTFAAALGVTNPGGEIVVLTSGGYGPATISQPVIITAIGVDASITQATFNQNAVTINTAGNVTLVGLNLHGEGTGLNGVMVQQAGFLRLFNMLIENFAFDGVDFPVPGNLEIYGSSINDNQNAGLRLFNGSANAYVHSTSFSNDGDGVDVTSGFAIIADSSAMYNVLFGFTGGGTLTLINDRATLNTTGLGVGPPGTLYFSNCLIANNVMAYSIESGGTMAGTNPGTSFIALGQSTSGTLSTPISLQ